MIESSIKSRILVIKSVSFKELDIALEHVKNEQPDHEIELLLHAPSVLLDEVYPFINRFHFYVEEGKIEKKYLPSEVKKTRYDEVVVPVNKRFGRGFYNVLLAAKSIEAERIIMYEIGKDTAKKTIVHRKHEVFLFSMKLISYTIGGIVLIILSPLIVLTLIVGILAYVAYIIYSYIKITRMQSPRT